MNKYREQDEARQLICKSIYYHIKDRVKGVVKVYPYKEWIFVEIYGANDIVYKVSHKLSTSEIVQGFSSEQFSQNVFKWYKSYITNLFFL